MEEFVLILKVHRSLLLFLRYLSIQVLLCAAQRFMTRPFERLVSQPSAHLDFETIQQVTN
jgi:hypothetical protein